MLIRNFFMRGPKWAFLNIFIISLMLSSISMLVMPGFVGNSFSAVSLNWVAPTTNTDGTPLTDLSGFKIYYGTSAGQYTNWIDVHNVTAYAFTNLPAGTYYFATTAYNTLGIESAYSNEVIKTEAGSDTSAPIINAFSVPAASSSLTVSGIVLTATDNSGVTGYMITESSVAPASGAAGWSAAAPITYTAASAGAHTLYAWAKDAAGNVSASRSTSVTITLPDTTAPTVTAFTIPATSTSLTVAITSLTATDNVGAVGYMVKESATAPSATASGWSATAPTSYTAAAAGTHTLYAWAKDAAGNVSAGRSATVVIGTASNITINLSPSANTFINLDTNNNSASPVLNAYTWPADTAANAILMRFDLSSIPAGATIQSATLNLYLVDSDTIASYPTYNLSLNRIINHNPDISQATGYSFDGTSAWTANSDCYGNIPLAQADISSAYDIKAVDKTAGVKTWNATQMVADWLASPSSNYGLMINADTAAPADTYRTFASTNNATANMRPYLTVVYSTASSASNKKIIWRNTSTGENIAWNMNSTTWSGGYSTIQAVSPGTGWDIKAVADFNGDGQPDLLWRNSSTGQNAVWFMNGATWTGNSATITTIAPSTGWDIVGAGDFNGDGKPDILWRNSTTGDVNVWLMNGTTYTSGIKIGNVPDQNWKIAGVADFNGGGQVDILWRNSSTGQNIVWYMNGATWTGQSAVITSVTSSGWNIAGVADLNGDGQVDILWRNSSTGQNIVWYMNGATWTGQSAAITTVSDPNWKIVGIE